MGLPLPAPNQAIATSSPIDPIAGEEDGEEESNEMTKMMTLNLPIVIVMMTMTLKMPITNTMGIVMVLIAKTKTMGIVEIMMMMAAMMMTTDWPRGLYLSNSRDPPDSLRVRKVRYYWLREYENLF